MKRIIPIACLWLAASLYSYSQVKIGDNPGTIDPNSLLELESTAKGLLAPRVTLTDFDVCEPPYRAGICRVC